MRPPRNGNHDLFSADLSGQGSSALTGYSLELALVPKPVHTALAVSGGAGVGH